MHRHTSLLPPVAAVAHPVGTPPMPTNDTHVAGPQLALPGRRPRFGSGCGRRRCAPRAPVGDDLEEARVGAASGTRGRGRPRSGALRRRRPARRNHPRGRASSRTRACSRRCARLRRWRHRWPPDQRPARRWPNPGPRVPAQHSPGSPGRLWCRGDRGSPERCSFGHGDQKASPAAGREPRSAPTAAQRVPHPAP